MHQYVLEDRVGTFLSNMTAYLAFTFPSKRKIAEEQDCYGRMMKALFVLYDLWSSLQHFFLRMIELKDRNKHRLVVLLCNEG